MIRLLLLAFLAAALPGCSLPQTAPEFKSWAMTSSRVTRTEFTVPGTSLAKAEARLRAFSKKCLELHVNDQVHYRNGTTAKWASTFRSDFSHEGGDAEMIVRELSEQSIGFPPGGRFDIWVKLTTLNGNLHAFVAQGPMFKDLPQDLESWIRGQGQFCPEP